jgi:hypothetical protein
MRICAGGARGTRTPALTRQNADLPAGSLRLIPIQSRSCLAVFFSGPDDVNSRSRWRGLRPIVFVLNNSGNLSERLPCKNPTIAYNEIAAWNYGELPHALGCQGWFTARVSTCEKSTTHSRRPSNPMMPPTTPRREDAPRRSSALDADRRRQIGVSFRQTPTPTPCSSPSGHHCSIAWSPPATPSMTISSHRPHASPSRQRAPDCYRWDPGHHFGDGGETC